MQEVHFLGAGELAVSHHNVISSGLPEGSARQSGMAIVPDRKAANACMVPFER